MRFRFFVFALCCVHLMACSDRQVLVPKSSAAEQWAYFPLSIGRYSVWQVDSVVYDFAAGGGTLRDSSRTLVRETITDTLRDNTGQLVFQIERAERRNAADAWQLVSIHTAARNATQAISSEQNFRFLKLVFPMDRRSEWNGNVWIDAEREIEIAGERMRPFSNWAYEVDSIDIAAQVGSFSFDSTLVVTEADDVNIIEKRFSRVRYAKNVGLVYREQWILDSQYCNATPVPIDCETKPWEEKAEKGYILRQVIIEHN